MTTAAAKPVPRRRRGAALEDAIRTAAYDELCEVGYQAFSVEGVAARARTGKASIYRRWPTKQELILDAADTCLAPIDLSAFTDDDDVPTAAAFQRVALAITAVLNSPAGAAMRAIKFEALADPGLARLVDERFQAPRREGVLALLRRGVARGEVRPDAVTALVADVLPAVLTYRIVMQREALRGPEIRQILDEVFLPLVEAR